MSLVPADTVIPRKSHGVNPDIYAEAGPQWPLSQAHDGRINLPITTKGLEWQEWSQGQLRPSLLIFLSGIS